MRLQWSLLALVITVGTLAIFRPLVGRFRFSRPNAMTVLVVAHLVFAVVPAAGFMLDPKRAKAFLYLSACLVTTPMLLIGLVLGHLIVGGRSSPSSTLLGREADVVGGEARDVRQFVGRLVVFSLLLTIAYVGLVGKFPLKALLIDRVAPDVLRNQRADATGQGTIFNIARLFLMPFLFACVLASWRVLRNGHQRWIGVMGLLVALFYNSFSSRKTPVAVLFALGIFLFLHERQAGAFRLATVHASPRALRRRRRTLLILGAAAFLGLVGYPLLIFSFKPFGQNRTTQQVVLQGIVQRIAEVPASNSYYAFELFPTANGGYTDGRDIPLVAQVTGTPLVDISQAVAVRQGFDADVDSPPTSVGAFWAEGGWIGVVVGGLLAGAMFGAGEALLLRRRRNPVVLAMYALLLFGAVRFSLGYFHAIVLSETFAPLVLVFVLWRPRHVDPGNGATAPLAPLRVEGAPSVQSTR
jgi:hypothetical protein